MTFDLAFNLALVLALAGSGGRVICGGRGSITVQAARFCVEHNVTVICAGWLGELMTFVSSHPRQDAALVRAQCRADPVRIAHELVIQKMIHYRAEARCDRAT
jgi:hypothetical protein